MTLADLLEDSGTFSHFEYDFPIGYFRLGFPQIFECTEIYQILSNFATITELSYIL